MAPAVTPDNRWVVYSSEASGTPTLWKVPLEGGEPVQLTAVTSMDPVVSPDAADGITFGRGSVDGSSIWIQNSRSGRR